MDEEEFCGKCGESFRGEEISVALLSGGYYGDWEVGETKYSSTKLGIEVQGVYDGILIWKCEKCNHMWPRFSEENSERLHKKALEIIKEWENK